MRFAVLIVAAATVISSMPALAAGKNDLKVSTSQVVGLTKFLEEHPRNEQAPAVRALMLDWEDKTKDVVDYVCPGVLAPVPNDGVPNGPELLAQFILSSAAFQIANPSQKGALQPSQLAGMRSMLKVYQAFLASDPKARIPRFDELLAKEADGSLPAYLEPVVAAECKQ
ncbi:hypothetical protein [Rhodanobacter hydrolyticus]|uniref:Uncharacterized protein n=1 Tax=Rhodanobacter hydrolyticus TaxID=2250595 RepID=A0ABW8J6Q3_9GAMM